MVRFQVAVVAVGAMLVDVASASEAVEVALPSFERTLMLENVSETSANVSVGDLNGDGHADIVLIKGRHWRLFSRVLLNDGRGAFEEGHNLNDAPARSYSGKLADIDGDGDLDVVVSNDRSDPKLVHLNDGSGHFRTGSEYGHRQWHSRNAEVADLNGDSFPDIIVANRGEASDNANYVCLNRGRGIFEATCTAFSRELATTISAADFNNDGFADLAVAHREAGQSHVYLNDGKAVFDRQIAFGPPDAHFRMALAADLNGDKNLDLVGIDEKKGVFAFFLATGRASSLVVWRSAAMMRCRRRWRSAI